MNKFIQQNKLAILRVVTIFIMVILCAVLVYFLLDKQDEKGADIGETQQWIGVGAVFLVGIAVVYSVVVKYFRSPEKKRRIYRNKYHDVFFKGTVIFAILLAIGGNLYGLLSYFEGGNPYRIVGLSITVIWLAVFMIYFVWSVYFYNINYGITDEEWEKIFRAKEMNEFGVTHDDPGLVEPLYNPYRSQTFGLPPGTVRGMIAFTLLIGGISLLISSYGLDYVSNAEVALRAKQFEFFETAFLMMIAFYFGDKSLKYLQKRWNGNQKPTEDNEEENSQKTSGNPLETKTTETFSFPTSDPMAIEDQAFLEEDEMFAENNKTADLTKPVTQLKNALNTTPTPPVTAIGSAYVQIMDNINAKLLIDEEIKEALVELKAEKEIELTLPIVKAVISVESSGRGHLKDGRAKILFEGHKFWYWLSKAGKKEEELAELQKEHPSIIYPKWTREYYGLGKEEYKRLELAKTIDEKAAVYSASWGLFQILGENLENNIKSRNYKDVAEFEAKQHEAEYYHFLDFLAFIQYKKLKGKALINYIAEGNEGGYDWASFAYGYNGRGYKVNKYDQKMEAAYLKFKKELG
ncbi:N-acetylmuramidase domain-containing protein [Echinicola sp. 20G]|uniref:N-acetylmuramidase domain-containing protein n=1 Tax=Echinicola sp. 20G TaxID=2781961 RepID=UPI00190FE8FC|nr:N-acetylmuramidase domain-containing protein [Echinicola sp. 20G]